MDLFSQAFRPSPAQSLPADVRKPYLLLGAADREAAERRLQEALDLINPPFSLDPDDPHSFVSRYGRPQGFDRPPAELDLATFLSWHSQAQLEYVYRHLANKDAVLRIGIGGDTVDMMITPSGVNVANPSNLAELINVNALTASGIGRLSLADQNRLLNDGLYPPLPNTQEPFNTFTREVLPGLGLETDLGVILGNLETPLAKLAAILADFNNTNENTHPVSDIDALQVLANQKIPGTNKPTPEAEIAQAALAALLQEINQLFAQIAASRVFDRNALNTAAQDILNLANALNVFASTITAIDAGPRLELPTAENGDDLINQNSINAQDPDAQRAGMVASFANLVRSQNAKSAAVEASNRITQSGGAINELGHRLSGPELMAAFVYNMSLKLLAIIQADTERFNQLNTLIKSYGVMQGLINTTLAKFVATDTDQTLALGGTSSSEIDLKALQLTPEERAALSMFLNIGKSLEIRASEDDRVIWEDGHFSTATGVVIEDALQEQIREALARFADPLANPIETLENVVPRVALDVAVIKATVDADVRIIHGGIGQADRIEINAGNGSSPVLVSIKLPAFDRQHWSTMLQQLTDSVTLLNQNSQLAFNKITSQSQQRTTFLTTASDALAKTSDILHSMTQNFV